jgi:hypothetical protein
MEVGAFIEKWLGIKGGAERANYAQFINDFCQALSLPVPQPAESGILGDYQFEGPVQGGGAGGNTGAIDLYKRGHFILEAKQSKLTPIQQEQLPLEEEAIAARPATPSGARYDRLMRDALAQAKRYAVNLPGNHPLPPFLIVCDVGRAFELYFDWNGNGPGLWFFPQPAEISLHAGPVRRPRGSDPFSKHLDRPGEGRPARQIGGGHARYSQAVGDGFQMAGGFTAA